MLVAPRRVRSAIQLARQAQTAQQWRSLSSSAYVRAGDSPQDKLRAMLGMGAAPKRNRGPRDAQEGQDQPEGNSFNRSSGQGQRSFFFNSDGSQRTNKPQRSQPFDLSSGGSGSGGGGQRRPFDPTRQSRPYEQRDGQRPRREGGQPANRDSQRSAQQQRNKNLSPTERAEQAASPEVAETAVDSSTARSEGARALGVDDDKLEHAERVGRKLQKRRQLRTAGADVNGKSRKAATAKEVAHGDAHRAKPPTYTRGQKAARETGSVEEDADVKLFGESYGEETDLDSVIVQPPEDDATLERDLLQRKTVNIGSKPPSTRTNAEEMANLAVDQGEKGHFKLMDAWPRPGEHNSKLRLEHPTTNWNDPVHLKPYNLYDNRQVVRTKMIGAPVVPHFARSKGFKYNGPTYTSSPPEAKQESGMELEKEYATPEAMKPFSVPPHLSHRFALYHYQNALPPKGLAWPEPKLARPRYLNLMEDKPNVSKGSSPTFSDQPEPQGHETWASVARSLNKTHATEQEARLAQLKNVDPVHIHNAYPPHTIWRAAEIKRRELLEVKGGDYSQYTVKPLTLAQLGLDPKDPEKKHKLTTGQRAVHNARSALSMNPRITLDGKEFSAKAINHRLAEIP